MPRVTVNITNKLRRIYGVRDGTTIGRDANCEIQLLNKSVSRIHARFEVMDDFIKIVDLASANGVKVNGERIDEQLLEDGDEIKTGKILMHFEALADTIPPENITRVTADADIKKILDEVSALNAFRMSSPSERESLDNMLEIGEGYIRSRKGYASFDCDLLTAALREAVGNAEIHGNMHDPQKEVTVTFRDAPKELQVIVEDEGAGFDFAAVLRESREGDAVEAARRRHNQGRIGGLGIRLILSAANHVNYMQDGSCVEIIKNKHTGMSAVETQLVTLGENPPDLIDEDLDAEPELPAAEESPEQVIQPTEKELDLKAVSDVEVVKSTPHRPDTWDDDIAITPPPITDLKASQNDDAENNEVGEPQKDVEEEIDEIIEEIAELEDVEEEDGTSRLHSTTWYVKQMEKKQKSERIETINLDEEDEEEEKI
ncbi:MAG: FHA domain-containing protein [Planctomycetota bacterium]|jgi:anti-sigma regulatory factor (Ser/Thr protein kinase)